MNITEMMAITIIVAFLLYFFCFHHILDNIQHYPLLLHHIFYISLLFHLRINLLCIVFQCYIFNFNLIVFS